MTTIAISSKTMTLASDMQYNHTGGLVFKGGPKFHVLDEHVALDLFKDKKAVVGGAGSAGEMGDAWSWFRNYPGKMPIVKHTEFAALAGDGRIYHSANLRNWILVDQEYYAIGSGMEYAMGAMGAGKLPEEAVEIAIEFDKHSGYGVAACSL